MEIWYALALADGTPLLAWDPEIGLENGVLRLGLTLDEESARTANAVWRSLEIPESDCDVNVRVVLDALPEKLAACADILSGAEHPAKALVDSSFVEGDSLAILHQVESFVPVEWRIDEVVDF